MFGGRVKLPEYIKRNFDKYKYVLLVCLVGLILCAFPSTGSAKGTKQQTPEADTVQVPQTEALERSLETALSQVDGVGRVEVVLTIKSGYEQVYAYDQRRSGSQSTGGEQQSSQSDLQTSMVLISGNGGESPATIKVNYPTYMGAVIICDGADNAAVQLSLIEAVRALTGISSENISILKMKN